MFLFQSPPPTRFDLNFNILGIPVRVHPMFWLLAALLGFGTGQVLIWVFVVFFSILIHEVGHALAFRRYGQDSYIVLHFMGGLTIPDSLRWGNDRANVSLSPNQQIFISLAGPFAGFILAGLVIGGVIFSGGMISVNFLLGFIPIPQLTFLPFGNNAVYALLVMLLWVNVFWGLINLLPVFPLDGGQVARNVLIQYDPWDGARKSLWLSVITGGLIALGALLFLNSIYMAFLFGMLAFQSYQSLSGRY
ncbi:MAG TPA: site-2 protease family protein [Anaerolineales bacterium]|nr:site-2 protease family protein [Anaerolineales bacterium]